METNNEKTNQQLQRLTSLAQLQESLAVIQKNDNYSISIYNDDLTLDCVVSEQVKLANAFPGLKKEFFDILSNRLKENGFTDKRLRDSINYLIDNFTYPIPTIANIISFDKRVKLYNYLQLIEKINEGDKWGNYHPIKKIGNKYYYASEIDVKTYNLEVLK